MNTNDTLTVAVIGCGNMGGALLKGWSRASATGAARLRLVATARSQASRDAFRAVCPDVDVTLTNAEAAAVADCIVLAVKPWFTADVLREIRPVLASRTDAPLLVSVAANITSRDLQELLDLPLPTVYAMPNIAAEFNESMTFVEEAPADAEPSGSWSAAIERAAALFRLVGDVRVVPLRLMAPGMMMAGCGIAYVMRYVRAMMEGGVEMGFYPAEARQIALQTMQGAVTLLQETGLHPEVAVDKVTTPGGITIRGLNELDHSGFNSAVIRSLKAGLAK